jgi:hypothetical protein
MPTKVFLVLKLPCTEEADNPRNRHSIQFGRRPATLPLLLGDIQRGDVLKDIEHLQPRRLTRRVVVMVVALVKDRQ